jgi:tripartite-type tricarboxylate transporter receptor subunit TctC
MSDLAARLLADKAKAAFVHESSADPQAGYEALRRGTIDVAIDGLPHALVEAGRGDVRIVGVTSPARSSALPLVTSFGEAWPGEDFSVLALVATSAAETPEVRAAIRRAWQQAARSPAAEAAFAQAGATLLASSERPAIEALEEAFLRHAGLIARYPPRRR